LAKTFAPQENRVHGAESVNDYGQQEKMPVEIRVSVSEPHGNRLVAAALLASRKCVRSSAFTRFPPDRLKAELQTLRSLPTVRLPAPQTHAKFALHLRDHAAGTIMAR